MFIAAIVVAIVLELLWALTPYNLDADAYRYTARRAAFIQWARSRTPETKAALDQERQLLQEHFARVRWIFSFVLLCEIGCVSVATHRWIVSGRAIPAA